MDPIADVRSHIEAAANEPDYMAVNTLWLALLKLANLEEGKSELDRMKVLVDRIPVETVVSIVNDPSVDELLNLDPPLETIVSHKREELKTKVVATELEKVRTHRTLAPREALAGLGFILKSIRNKREHGFKTQFGVRDTAILRPTRHLLSKLSQAALVSRGNN